jgi:pimeloyl-ACP methyl ester carboxylesterase
MIKVTHILAIIAAYLLYNIVHVKEENGGLLHLKSRDWIKTGSFLNYQGYAIFYRDNFLLKEAARQCDEKQPIDILLHGFPSFSYDFAELFESLHAENHHVITLDFLGFGVSDKPSDIDYTLMMQADIVEEVLIHVLKDLMSHCSNAQNYSYSVSVISHDMGVSVAQELMARQLDGSSRNIKDSLYYNINGVVFLNGGIFPETHHPTVTQRLLLSKYTGPLVKHLMSYPSFAHSLSIVFGANTKPSNDDLKLYWSSVLYKGGLNIMHLLQQYIIDRRLNRERWVNALINSTRDNIIPVRFINGPADPVSGMHVVHRYKELVPSEGSDVIVLGQDIGHYPQLEDFAHVKQYIMEFLAKLG